MDRESEVLARLVGSEMCRIMHEDGDGFALAGVCGGDCRGSPPFLRHYVAWRARRVPKKKRPLAWKSGVNVEAVDEAKAGNDDGRK